MVSPLVNFKIKLLPSRKNSDTSLRCILVCTIEASFNVICCALTETLFNESFSITVKFVIFYNLLNALNYLAMPVICTVTRRSGCKHAFNASRDLTLGQPSVTGCCLPALVAEITLAGTPF